jgi:hypothetical protein
MIESQIQVEGEFTPSFLTLATRADLAEIDSWKERYKERASAESDDGAIMKTIQKLRDNLEYAKGALEKHKNYTHYGRCPHSWEEFFRQASIDESGEIGGLFVLKAPMLGDIILGFLFVRRTWTKNLALDYLSLRPLVRESVEGRAIWAIGPALFLSTCIIGNLFATPSIWWESSIESAPFYKNLLGFTHDSDRYELIQSQYQSFITTFTGQTQ